MFAAELGGRIRERREALGLKQTDVASALQVTPQAVSKWERGENAPDIACLKSMAKFFSVSTDWLLGCHCEEDRVFEATVMATDLRGYANKANSMTPQEVATWLKGVFFQVTESVLQYDGIPVKYIGDAFLSFFSGIDHQRRAVQASLHAKHVSGEDLSVGLACGPVCYDLVGHPDYASRDILGDTVNMAFRVECWGGQNTACRVAATMPVVEAVEGCSYRKHTMDVRGIAEAMTFAEVEGLTASANL